MMELIFGRKVNKVPIIVIIVVITLFIFIIFPVFMISAEFDGDSSGGSWGSSQFDSSGYIARTEMPYYGTEDYSKYYSVGLYGECAWYALGRTKEILHTTGSSYNWISGPNGSEWCNVSETNDFTVSKDYKKPKKGSIVSWRGGNGHNYGHVGIIEEVYYDENGNIDSVDISEAGLNINPNVVGTYSSNWIWEHDTLENRIKQCSNGKCFIHRKIPIDEIKDRNWTGYSFNCYIYLLKEDDISKYIVDKLSSNNGEIVKFYNWVSVTEGGEEIDIQTIRSKLYNDIEITGTLENDGYASVDPGLKIGKLGEVLEISINDKTYEFELIVGKTVPRWVALYKYIEAYNSHKNTVLNLINNSGANIKEISKIHSFMRLTWTYGPSGATDRINKMLSAYKEAKGNNKYKNTWCALSKEVWGVIDGESKIIGNYFNMNELTFRLFYEKDYSVKNLGYTGYKYYTKDLIKDILKDNPSYGTGYLEAALESDGIPDTSEFNCLE